MVKVTAKGQKRKDKAEPGGSLPPLKLFNPNLKAMLLAKLPPMAVVIISGRDIEPSIAWVAEPEFCDRWVSKFNADPVEGVQAISVPVEYHIAGHIVDGGKVGAA